ncbi:MAG: hypothetical protein IJN42_00005, partial [Clostridia bacterium]|nr:hypothetical protein [Clostridia bacterium]
ITPEAIDTYSIKTETDDSFSAKFVSATIPSSANEAYLASSPMPGAIRSNFEDSVAAIPPNMKVLGELFKVYAVIEFQDTLYLVDKHAAHEKLIYNRLIEQVQENNNIASQSLLEPIVVVLPADDLDVVLNNAVLFYTAGFDFYESGPDRVSLTSAPSILPGESYTEAFVDLLEMIRKNKSGVTDRQDQALKTIACRSAIKGGSDCTIQELLPLISKIITEKDVGYCPHGRPVIQSLTHKEIDKMFKRIK